MYLLYRENWHKIWQGSFNKSIGKIDTVKHGQV